MGYYPKEGDLVQVCTHDNETGVVLRVFAPLVYQRGTAEVLLGNEVILVEHSYLVHAEELQAGRTSVDTVPGGTIRLLRYSHPS